MTSSKTATDCAHVEIVWEINNSGSGGRRGAVVEGSFRRQRHRNRRGASWRYRNFGDWGAPD